MDLFFKITMYIVNMKNLDVKIKWSWVQISPLIHKLDEFVSQLLLQSEISFPTEISCQG